MNERKSWKSFIIGWNQQRATEGHLGATTLAILTIDIMIFIAALNKCFIVHDPKPGTVFTTFFKTYLWPQ
jgi:hypothetical protein